MTLYLHILIILNFLFSNLIFSQEETTKFYITELRGDISLEMEINNLESNKGPIYIRILDENENPVIVGTSPVINYSSEISFDSIFPGKYAIQFFHDENENQKMDFNLIGIPFQILIGKNPDKNKVEFKEVGNDSKMISLEEALNFIKSKKIN